MGKGDKALIKFEKLDPNSRFKNPLYAMKHMSSSRSLSVESITNNICTNHKCEFKATSAFSKGPCPHHQHNHLSCLKKCHTINNYINIKHEKMFDRKKDIKFEIDIDLNNYDNNSQSHSHNHSHSSSNNNNNSNQNQNKDENQCNCKDSGHQFELNCRNPLYRKKKRKSFNDHYYHQRTLLSDNLKLNFEDRMIMDDDNASKVVAAAEMKMTSGSLVGMSSSMCDSHFDIQMTDMLMMDSMGMEDSGVLPTPPPEELNQIMMEHGRQVGNSEVSNEKSGIINDIDDVNKNKLVVINKIVEKEKHINGKHRRSVARDVFEIGDHHDIDVEMDELLLLPSPQELQNNEKEEEELQQEERQHKKSIENMIYDPYETSFELALDYGSSQDDNESYSNCSYTFDETNDIELNSKMNSNVSDYTQICSQNPLTLDSFRTLNVLHDNKNGNDTLQQKRSFFKNAKMFFSEKFNDERINEKDNQDSMKNDIASQLSKSWSAGLDARIEKPIVKEKKKSIIPKIVRKMGKAIGKKLKLQSKDTTKLKLSKIKKAMSVTFVKRSNANEHSKSKKSPVFRTSYPEGICGMFTKEFSKTDKTIHNSVKSKISSHHTLLESVPSWNAGPMVEPKEMPPLSEIMRSRSSSDISKEEEVVGTNSITYDVEETKTGMYSESHFTMEAELNDVLSEFDDMVSKKSDTPTFLHLTSTEFQPPPLLFNNNEILKMEGLWRPYWPKCNVNDIDRSIYVSKGFEKISKEINYFEIYLKNQTIKLYTHNGRRKLIDIIHFDVQNGKNVNHGYLTSKGFRSMSKDDDLSREELYWLDNHDQTLHLEILIISDSGNSRTLKMCYIKESNL